MQIKSINPNKFHDELIAQGIKPLLVQHDKKEGEYIAENTYVSFLDDIDMELVQQIIDAHDPTPLPPKPTKEEILEQELANTNAMILELTELILGGM